MNVYEIITNKILNSLKQGVIPWKQPFINGQMPQNYITRRPYSGINVFLLNMQKYSSPFWLTFKQVQELGGSIHKGEKSTQIIFCKTYEVEEENSSEDQLKSVMSIRYYNVFNLTQVEGIPVPILPEREMKNPIAACEDIISQMPSRPEIRHIKAQPFYHPEGDYINIPNSSAFISSEEYYSTLFHELTHSTGHSTRLNRPTIVNVAAFGSHEYSKEELIAEMGSTFLSAHAGISTSTIENSVAYIGGWLKVLADDPMMVIRASSQAQKAVDFILGKDN